MRNKKMYWSLLAISPYHLTITNIEKNNSRIQLFRHKTKFFQRALNLQRCNFRGIITWRVLKLNVRKNDK